MIFVAIITLFLVIPGVILAEDISWDCTKTYQIKHFEAWAIFNNPTEAQVKAEATDGEIVPIKDESGSVAYMVKYKVSVVSENLFEKAECL